MNWASTIKRGYQPAEFDHYVRTGGVSGVWRPQFVVLHNTGVPQLKDWHSTPGQTRMANLEHYYRDIMGWHAGPHLFVADDLIWVFTPLSVPGVHSPSWNAVSWGVEMVGDYDTEAFDVPAPGKTTVRSNTISALATLHAVAGLDSHTLRLHKEDPATTHKGCPGRHVDKADMIARVHALIAERNAGEHLPTRP